MHGARVKISLLEDDEALSQLMCMWIEAAGHSCVRFANGESFMKAIRDGHFDLIILDWELPDTTGDVVVEWIRQSFGWQLPVIFVTQRSSQEDLVSALQKGADDYMIKPVRPMEMLARISALGRRVYPDLAEQRIIDREPYRFEIDTRTFMINRQVISLTEREFDLGLFLFRNAGQMLSRALILEKVWGRSSEVNTRTVDIHVSRLRKKAGLSGEHGWRLTGVYNHGYRLERAYRETNEEILEEELP